MNMQIEARIELNKELVRQYTALNLTSDQSIRSAEGYEDALADLKGQIYDNVDAMKSLADSQKALAEEQIAEVADLQEKIVSVLRERYSKEAELVEEGYSRKIDALNKEKDALKKAHDNRIKSLEDEQGLLQDMWDEQDKRAAKEEKESDLAKLRSEFLKLQIAAETGDSGAISRRNDLAEQIADAEKDLAKDAETERRQQVEDDFAKEKEFLSAEYDASVEGIDNQISSIEVQKDAAAKANDARLANDKLYAEAKLILERNTSQQMIDMLVDYEKQYGAGMGILYENIVGDITTQVNSVSQTLAGSLSNLIAAVQAKDWKSVIEILANTDEAKAEVDSYFNELSNAYTADETVYGDPQDNKEKDFNDLTSTIKGELDGIHTDVIAKLTNTDETFATVIDSMQTRVLNSPHLYKYRSK